MVPTGPPYGNTIDNFGLRLSAYFIAPSSGFYRFYIRSDDDSQLFMNTNGINPAGKVSIAYLSSWRGYYQTNVPHRACSGPGATAPGGADSPREHAR